jgi:hypothetical protein
MRSFAIAMVETAASKHFKQTRGAHAATDTHRHDDVLDLSFSALDQGVTHHAST